MTTSSVHTQKLTAAVLGGSIAGLMASLVLHKKKFEVTLYEQYPEYTRSIQWTVRQSFIDYLYSVDKDIADHLFTKLKLVSPVTNGYRFLSDKTLRFPDGAYLYKRRDGLRVEAPDESPGHHQSPKPDKSCAASLAEDFVGIIRARDLEKHLREQIQKSTDVNVLIEKAPEECVLLDDGRYALKKKESEDKPTSYDLIVGCVGAGASRNELFPMIKFNPVSRKRPQVSGDVQLERHGMVTAYQHAKIDKEDEYLRYLPSGELLYSTLLSTDRDKTTCWVIGDVSTEFEKRVAKLEKDKEKAKQAKDKEKAKQAIDDEIAKLAKEECGKIAARTMLATEKQVLDAGVNGVVDETVRRFVSQAKISSAACAGDNLVLAGDAVGAGHWAVGGGMHVAGLCHQKRLEALADLFAKKTDRKAALKDYSVGVLEDTMAWISKSMEFYYLSIPKDVVNEVFKEVRIALEENRSIDAPKEMQERIISVYFGLPSDTDPEAATMALPGFDAIV